MNARLPNEPREAPGKWASLALTVLVHLGLIAFLVLGVRWQSAPPAALEVDLVAAPPAQPAPPPEPKPEPKPEPPKPEPPKPEPPKPAPKPEPPPKPLVKPDIATKPPEPKKPPKPEPPKPEPKKPEPKAEPKKPEPKKPEPVVPPKDDYMTKRLEQEAANRQLERMLRDDAARAATARTRAVGDAYQNAVRTKVRGNLLRPPGLGGNPEAVFEVDQLPSGEVIAIRLKRSSGTPALDEAIERAIRRSSPLPLPDAKELFERTLELKFRPLEE